MEKRNNYANYEIKQHLNKSLNFIDTQIKVKYEKPKRDKEVKNEQNIWWWRWPSYNSHIEYALQLHFINDGEQYRYLYIRDKREKIAKIENTEKTRKDQRIQNNLRNFRQDVIQNNIKLKKLYAAVIVTLTCGWHSIHSINLKFLSSFIIFITLIFLTVSFTNAFPKSVSNNTIATIPNYTFSNNSLLLQRLEVKNDNNNVDLEKNYFLKNIKRHKTYDNSNRHQGLMLFRKRANLNFIETSEIDENITAMRSTVTVATTAAAAATAPATAATNNKISQESGKIVSNKLLNNHNNNIYNNSTIESSISSPLSSTTTITTTTNTEEICEAKILDDLPTEPFYDFSDIAEGAAQQFSQFLHNKYTSQSTNILMNDLPNEIKEQANAIVNSALNEDDNLLAFAMSVPSVNMVVLKFRDNVTIPPEYMNNHENLGFYWRELDYEWSSLSNSSQEWGVPFKDCNFLIGRWLWPFRMSFYDSKIRITVAAFIAADEDVCNDGLEQIFGRKHGCDRNTTFCLLTENKPIATRDVYMCICKESYYLPNSTLQGFRGDVVEMSEDFDNYSCIPCPGGCTTCDLNGICIFGEPQDSYTLENILKLLVGSILAACIISCLGVCVIVLRERKSKVIAFGMWTVLEIILIGILLLYASVVVHFFPASTERCLLEPWLRELGFITCYGAIILKLYRHLIHFRTRKAHRWIFRDVDLLKYLSTMIFAVVCYMSAFMASALDLLETTELKSLREIQTNTCRPLKWEYVTQISEIIILLFGLYLAIISRNAITYFKERQFLVATLLIEFLVSSIFYLLRFMYLPEMSPSTILLVLFLRSQLTTTVALTFIFVPKLWYLYKHASHAIDEQHGGVYAGLCLGDPEIGELTISDMSPEDIRAELKRLYTQLELLKNKTLRQNNPHISKRRGGRKIGHRRFSLQMSSAKHRYTMSHQNRDMAEPEPSRTPEDSICSNEGPIDPYPNLTSTSEYILP